MDLRFTVSVNFRFCSYLLCLVGFIGCIVQWIGALTTNGTAAHTGFDYDYEGGRMYRFQHKLLYACVTFEMIRLAAAVLYSSLPWNDRLQICARAEPARQSAAREGCHGLLQIVLLNKGSFHANTVYLSAIAVILQLQTGVAAGLMFKWVAAVVGGLMALISNLLWVLLSSFSDEEPVESAYNSEYSAVSENVASAVPDTADAIKVTILQCKPVA